MTKTARLSKALRNGDEITIKEAQKRFGFAHPHSVTGTIWKLRIEGLPIFMTWRGKNGRTQKVYSLENATTQHAAAAGYRTLNGTAPLTFV